MKTKKEKIAEALKKYIPEGYIEYVMELMFSEKLAFRISKPRKTKAGDYRPPYKGEPHRISINGDLNPYAFLITTIHEFAHMTTFIKYGPYVKAHGPEWKGEFKRLLIPVLEKNELPDEIEAALKRSLQNLKASSCTDLHLTRALKKHDEIDDSLVLLEDLGNNEYFRLGDKTFQRGILRRRRYLCKEINTGKQYLVNRLAEVEPINEK
ncbi:MAG TPA: SprT-like domain-containing protein [Brumimicrobium sp.]|nr:SprT-like domain-containing protein [Brumimicrobium sp.]